MLGTESRHPPGLVVMLTGDLTRYADSMSAFSSLRVPLGAGLTWFKGCLIADGLNKSFMRLFEQPGLEWVWVMGDDHDYGPDVLIRQLDKDVDVSIPLCLHRMPPFPTNITDRSGIEPRSVMVSEMPTSGLYTLGPEETCGDAGMLIRKRVLEAIPSPWYDTRRSGSFASDDQAFSVRVQEAGFEIHVDCDVPIGHITPMTVTPSVRDGEWKIALSAGDKPVCALNPAKS